MSRETDALTGLLPSMTQLSSTLSRGQLFEWATAEAGVPLERPAVTVLLVLDTAGEPLRVGEIATRMQVAGPHVTRLLHGLEQRGLVTRVPDQDDQRVRLITLTAEGERLIGGYLRVINGWFTAALAGWSDPDRRDLVRLLGRLVADLSAYLDTVVGGEH
jgi:DNA-binding MarR family transcriptional regulator